MNGSRLRVAVVILFLATTGSLHAAVKARYFGPSNTTGASAAVLIDDAALVHTAQLLPLDHEGKIVGKGQPAVQIEKVYDNLAIALAEVRANVYRIVKLNVYAASPEVVTEVRKFLGTKHFRLPRPAVSFVVGKLAHPEALVAMDAVAYVVETPTEVKRIACDKLPGAKGGSHLAIMPAGARVYVAGQAEKGDLAEATRKTLESLRATLTFLGLNDASIVQLKAFMHPMTEVAVVEKEIAKHFGKQAAPPLVLVEWSSSLPIEIELIAHAGPAQPRANDVVEFLTPPGMQASPIYSRVTRINSGKTIYISSLYADKAVDAEGQVEEIFTALGKLLDEAGSDFRHLVKATYYVSDDPASRKLNELRPRYYDPRRPPSASKAMVAGTGVAGKTITLDMIAVPSPLRAEGKPEFGHGLTPKEVEAGWISLFDGKTSFGWEGAKVQEGQLIGGNTTGELPNCELVIDVVKEGNLIVAGGRVIAVRAGPSKLKETGKRGPIRLGPETAIRSLVVRPLGLQTIFNGKDLTGWQRIDHPKLVEDKRPKWTVERGLLHAVGGPGALEYQKEKYGDLVLQIDARTCARHANGGVFFRCQPALFMMGYEAQVYNCCIDGDPSKPARWCTGGIDDRQNARRMVSRDFETFRMTVIANGPHLATWVNGHQLTDWTDTRAANDNPRQGLRLEPGTIQLQAHDPATDVEFKNIQIAELK